MINAGDSFGSYKVVRKLGQGGMGEVWLLESASGRPVAAKFLDPESAGDHEARKRFLREAQLAIDVKHPNLVETYDVGEDPDTGLCYILMEYVSGGSLADYLKENGALPIEDAVAVVEAMAGVLELGRQKGIVHRDIKPANIMFDEEGTPKLADLGIARGGSAGTETTTVTQTGMMIGTPAYMAPEQMLDAHNVDTRADIYSLGVVFFEMLTGERPNKDDTVVQLMAKAVKGEALPDVRTLRPEVSASLAQLLAMMVAPDKEGRISTPGQITNAIAIIERGGTLEAERAGCERREQHRAGQRRRRKRRRLVLMLALSLATIGGLVGIGVGIRFLMRPDAPVQADRPVPPSQHDLMEHKVVTDKVVADKVVTDKIVTNEVVTIVKTNVVTKVIEMPRVADADHSASSGRAAIPDDQRILEAKVGEYAWKYALVNGGAVITSGPGGYDKHAVPAVDPPPVGKLEVPDSIDGHPVVAIGNRAFFKCTKLTEVVIPEGVRELKGWGTFYMCSQLKRVLLPRSLQSVSGWSVFMCCNRLEELDLRQCAHFDGNSLICCSSFRRFACDADNPGLSVDSNGALYDRQRRTLLRWPSAAAGYTIPTGIAKVGFAAFEHCYVEFLTLPPGLEEIDSQAFARCVDLRELRIPAGLRTVGRGLFDACRSLKRIVFEGDAPVCRDNGHSQFDKNSAKDLVVCVKRGSKGWRADGGEGLPKLWPDDGDVDERRRICYVGEEDKLVPMPADAGGIDAKRKSVRNPYAERPREMNEDRRIRMTKVGNRTWFYCLSGDDAVLWRGNYGYNGKTKSCVEPEPTGRLEIPSELDGHRVVRIESLAFFECKGLLSVRIPEGVKELRGWGCFYNCQNLKTVELPESLLRIDAGSSPFDRCRSLNRIDLKNCKFVDGEAFKGCSALRKIEISDRNEFYCSKNGVLYSKNLDRLVAYPKTVGSLVIPKSVRVIGEGACASCAFKGKVVVPEHVEEVEEDAFRSCAATEIVIAGANEVYLSAFRDCDNLVKATFSDKLKVIGNMVFEGDVKLERVVFHGNAPQYQNDPRNSVFGEKNGRFTVFVCKGSTGWKAPGSDKLPKTWPIEGLESSHPIVFLDGATPASVPTADSASSFTPAQISRMQDTDGFNAMRKATETMFKGWRVNGKLRSSFPKHLRKNNVGESALGYLPEYNGVTDVLRTYGDGVLLEWPKTTSRMRRLRFMVCGSGGIVITLEAVGSGPTFRVSHKLGGTGWEDVDFDLFPLFGRAVTFSISVSGGFGDAPTIQWHGLKFE